MTVELRGLASVVLGVLGCGKLGCMVGENSLEHKVRVYGRRCFPPSWDKNMNIFIGKEKKWGRDLGEE